MTMTAYSETESLIGTEFSPYDDSTTGYPASTRIGAQPEHVIAIFNQSGSGMDTSAFDKFRQGVEMRIPKHVYGSTQPKLWAGNLLQIPRTYLPYGEARTWTEYENTTEYYDNTIPFNPVQYIKSQNNNVNTYPFPIYFNDGPQEGQEAIMEPLTIPFRAATSYVEGAFPARRPKGNLEDGNPTPDIPQSNNRVYQFIDYNSPLTPDPYLDAGQEYIGAGSIEDAIIREGYVDFLLRLGDPFDDTETEVVVKQLQFNTGSIAGQTFLATLLNLDIGFRRRHKRKLYSKISNSRLYCIWT